MLKLRKEIFCNSREGILVLLESELEYSTRRYVIFYFEVVVPKVIVYKASFSILFAFLTPRYSLNFFATPYNTLELAMDLSYILQYKTQVAKTNKLKLNNFKAKQTPFAKSEILLYIGSR